MTRLFASLRLKHCSVAFMAVLALFSGGCGMWSIDKDVARNPEVAWNPPAKSQPKTALSAGPDYKAGPIDLYGLIDVAFSNSTQNRRAWQQAKVAASEYGVAKTQWLPTGDVSLTEGRYYVNYNNGNSTSPQTSSLIGPAYETIFSGAINMNWVIFNFGTREASINAAREALYAANFNYNQSLQQLALNVEIAYFNLYQAEASVMALQANLEDARFTLDSAQKKLNSGLGNLQDMLLAKAQYLEVQFQIEQALGNVEAARANLASTVGMPVSFGLQIIPPTMRPPTDMLDQEVSTHMAEALRARPSLLAAYSQKRATDWAVEAAYGALFPSLNVGAEGLKSNGADGIFQPNEYGILTISAQWNVFEIFTDHFKLLDYRARQKIAEADLKQAELSLMAEVWTYYYGFKAATQQVNSAVALVEANIASFQAMKIGYGTGVTSLLELLQAQNNLATARLQQVQADASMSTSLANLTYSTGKMMMGTQEPISVEVAQIQTGNSPEAP